MGGGVSNCTGDSPAEGASITVACGCDYGIRSPSRLRRASAEGGEGGAAQQAGGEQGLGKRGGTPLVGGFEHVYGG